GGDTARGTRRRAPARSRTLTPSSTSVLPLLVRAVAAIAGLAPCGSLYHSVDSGPGRLITWSVVRCWASVASSPCPKYLRSLRLNPSWPVNPLADNGQRTIDQERDSSARGVACFQGGST